MADMIYDGKWLNWSPKGEKSTYSFRATSGLVDTSGDYRFTSEQCSVDRGPLPEGTYVLSLELDSKPAQDKGIKLADGSSTCDLKPSWKIQTIPRGTAAGKCEQYWANWGESRVRLEPANGKTRRACNPRRGGFYLHDSAKGYTHGCIETDKRFFTLLRKHAMVAVQKMLTLQIKYATTSTYGETDK